jgi:hypothetical protein
MNLPSHRRYTVAVPRHPRVSSPSARDIAMSDVVMGPLWDVKQGSPPESLDLRSRWRWRPKQAGIRVVSFKEGLLVLDKTAVKALPHLPPAAPPPTRVKAAHAAVVGTKIVAGPYSPLGELLAMFAEGAADAAVDGVGERYESAHPERERIRREQLASWQQAFAKRIPDIENVHVLPRVDIVRVSIVPFMLYGLNIQLRSHSGIESAYTFMSSGGVPARAALASAGNWFRGRLALELDWFSRTYRSGPQADHRAQTILDMRELLPFYAGIPGCVDLLDSEVAGWRAAL